MFYVSNYALAIFFCVVTMFCWGSWGNTQKLAGKTWRYELFYWDYVIGVLLFALISGLTAGSLGTNPDWGFVANLKQASVGNLGSAFLGGVVFNAANILLAAAISIAGMSVAFPVGIGLALVLGVVVNYVGAPKGDPLLLFGGVGLIVVAILCNAFAYRLKQVGKSNNLLKGIVLSIVCGVLMAFFYRFIAATMDMDFAKAAPAAGMMTPYSAFFVFALGIFVSNFVFNALAMRHPVSGEPITGKEYFKGGFPIHLVGILGGLIWGLGNGINLVAAGKAGAAISYGLGQGATLVSALWGILIWKEFEGAPKKAGILNLTMFVLFLAGLGLIIRAGEERRREPVKVIFDTDMYTDFDDVGALACLHALQDAGECEILATLSCTRDCMSVAMCEIVNAYYGRPEIPVGCVRGMGLGNDREGMHEKRFGSIVRKYAKWVRHLNSSSAPDAADVYRQVLSSQPDKSVVICSVGFLTNLRKLVEMDRDLVARKVRLWVAMACSYPKGREYNSMMDAASSRIALENWPTPVLFSDFQYGVDCYAGKRIADSDVSNSPVADAFRANRCDFNGASGRSAWDETAVLVAVRGAERYFNTHRGTYRMIGDRGDDEWVPDEANGPHVRITEKLNKVEVGNLIDELICRGVR